MLPAPWNPDQINPALMTSREYQTYCNQNNKWHDDSAYDFDLSKTHNEHTNKAEYTRLKTIKVQGLSLDVMYKSEKLSYAQRNPDNHDGMNPWLRVDGQIVYYSDEEIKRLGYQPYGFEFAIFDEDKRVAMAQDEWGCVLIAVASEYRSFGLGNIIGKLARTYEPGKTSGGFTPMGARNFRRLHREFVRDALTNGLYSKMVRSGQLTMERVREIVASVDMKKRPPKSDLNINSSDPKDWLLFADLQGSFILYDRKLPEILNNGKVDDMFVQRMIKGYVYAMPHESAGITRIKQFGGDSVQIKSFLLSLAYTNAVMDKLPLWVEKEEYDLPGFEYGPESNVVGHRAREVTKGRLVNYADMVAEERQFRKQFDQYSEFEYSIHDMAVGKFQITPEAKKPRWW